MASDHCWLNQLDPFSKTAALDGGRPHSRRTSDPSSLMSVIGDTPQSIVSVFAYDQRTVARHRHPYRPAPHLPIFGHKTSQEVFILSGGYASIKYYANDL